MNTKSKVRNTAREILTLISTKNMELHEAIAALREAKKGLKREKSC
jgi:hypothetical protein